MDKKSKRLTGLIVAVVFLSLVIYFTVQINRTEIGRDCSVILENEGDNKIEVVFFTDGVNKNEIKEYVSVLINSEPFLEHKEKFNFYFAGNANCKKLEGNLFCYSRDLLRKSSICPNDYIIVLADEKSSVRSSVYLNVISINIDQKKNVLLHEFAHTFGNIADEYVPSIIPGGAKNCVQECEEFEVYGDLEGCYEGCSKSDYYRSSEDSIMRTLNTNDFKKLNTFLLQGYLKKYE